MRPAHFNRAWEEELNHIPTKSPNCAIEPRSWQNTRGSSRGGKQNCYLDSCCLKERKRERPNIYRELKTWKRKKRASGLYSEQEHVHPGGNIHFSGVSYPTHSFLWKNPRVLPVDQVYEDRWLASKENWRVSLIENPIPTSQTPSHYNTSYLAEALADVGLQRYRNKFFS